MLESKKLKSINLLKCIAILMVLTVHQGQLFKNCGLYEISKLGQLGCQCFFLISGYTLCQSWDYRKQSLKSFYGRRIRAIIPGYYFDIILFTIISLVIQCLNLPHYWIQGEIIGVAHLENILLLHGAFPSAINSVVPGGWYIGTTILMYLSFPVLKKSIDYISKMSFGKSFMFPCIFVLLSFTTWYCVSIFETELEIGNNTFLYFNIITQYPCFVMGAVIYSFIKNHRLPKSKISLIYYGVLSLIFAFATLRLFYTNNLLIFCFVPFLSSCFFGCVLLILIKLIDLEETKLPNFINNLCAKISGVSYEMYLLHTLFAYFLVWYIRKGCQMIGYGFIFDYSVSFVLFLIFTVTGSYYCGKQLKKLLNKFLTLINEHTSIKYQQKQN